MTLNPKALEAGLLPCPFCGRQPHVAYPETPSKMMEIGCPDNWYGKTGECDVAPAASGHSFVETAAHWNRRASLPSPDPARVSVPGDGRLGPSLEERMPTPEEYAQLGKIITDAFAEHASAPPATVELEPVAWEVMDDDANPDASLTRSKDAVGHLRKAGFTVRPLYATPPTTKPRVQVAGLVWEKHPAVNLWRADTLLGRYQAYAVISQVSWAFDAYDGITQCSGDASSAEDAKAACQADYTARILSALVSEGKQ